MEVNGKSRGLTNLTRDLKLLVIWSATYDPRKEIGVLQYLWTDGVSERYDRPSQIATSSTYYNGGCSAYYEYTVLVCFTFVVVEAKEDRKLYLANVIVLIIITLILEINGLEF